MKKHKQKITLLALLAMLLNVIMPLGPAAAITEPPPEGMQPPHVVFVAPGPGSVVPTNIKSWYVEFDKPVMADSLQNNVQMRKVSFTASTMSGPTFTPVDGVKVDPIVDQAAPNLAVAAEVYFAANQPELDAFSEYELVLKPGILDQNNLPLNGWKDSTNVWQGFDHVVNFSTGAGPDNEAPKILATQPAKSTPPASNVPVDTSVTVVFSEDITKDSVFENNVPRITLNEVDSQGAVVNKVYGDFSYDHERKAVVITPDTFLKPNTGYTLVIAAGISDMVGNTTSVGDTIPFTTGGPINDTKGPALLDAKAIPFEVSAVFSEDLLFDAANRVSTAVYSPLNPQNYILETSGALNPSWTPVDLTGKQIFYEPEHNSVRIVGLFLKPGDNFKITAYNLKDRSGNLVDPNANTFTGIVQEFMPGPGTGGYPGTGGGTGFMEKPKAEAWPSKPMAGAESEYHIGVPIFGPEGDKHYSLGPGSTIEITFPEGFDVSNAAMIPVDAKYGWDPYAKVSGSGGITVTAINKDIAGRKVIVTLGGTGTTGEPDFISFPIKGIKNSDIPQKPGSAGYKITVTTKTDGGAVGALNLESHPFFINETGTRQIRVELVAKDGSTPIAELDGVPVRIDSFMAGFQKDVTTGGVANFIQLSEGFYNVWIDPVITINNHDYLASEVQQFIEIDANSPNPEVVTFKLVDAANASDLGTITGTITGGPANQTVVVWAGSPELGYQGYLEKEVALDANGSANFTFKAGTGNWWVGVRPAFNMDQTASTFMASDWIPSPPQQVEIEGPSDTAQVDLDIITANKTISGKVLDENGQGIAFAEVFAYSPNGFGYPAWGKTASDGSYILKVPAGTYTVGAFMPGLPPLPDISVVVEEDQPGVSGVDFKVFKPDSSISGQVTDENGNAIAGAPVWARMENGFGSAYGETDDQGKYTLYVTSGTWIVEAYAPGFGPLGAKTVVLDQNNPNATNKNFSPSANFSNLSGTVAWNADGTNGVSGAMIWAEGINSTSGGNGAVTGSDGSFDLKVPYGNYRIHAFVPGLGDLTPVEVTVDVPTKTVDGFKGIQKGTLRVQFRANNQAFAVEEGFIDAWDKAAQRGNFLQIKDNSFGELDLPAGTYDLNIYVPGIGDLGDLAVDGSGQQVNQVQVTDLATTTVTVNIPQPVILSGTVTSGGNPVKDAWVWAADPEAGVNVGDMTDANGNYSIKVKPGTYAVAVDKPDFQGEAPETVTVNGNLDYDFTLIQLGQETVTGKVYGDNQPLSGARVWAISEDGGWFDTITNADGSYTLKVTPGEWDVKFTANGYTKKTSPDVVVNAGAQVNLGQVNLNKIAGYEVKSAIQTIIPSKGGNIKDDKLKVSITLPAGAISDGTNNNTATQVRVEETTNVPESKTATPLGGKGTEIKVDNGKVTNLSGAITVELEVGKASDLPPGVTLGQLKLGYWDDTASNWVYIPSTLVEDRTVGGAVYYKLRGSVTHLTTFAPLVPMPDAPSGLTATAAGTGEINLSWTVVGSATGYKVFRSGSANGTYTEVGTSTTNSYQNTGLTAATTYYYKVKAVNSSGESAFSAAASATTQATNSGSDSSGSGTVSLPAGGETVTVNPAQGGTVKAAGNAVEIQVPQGALQLPSGATAKFVVQEVAQAAVNSAVKVSVSGLSQIGKVYEFTAFASQNGADTKIGTFAKPLAIKLAYSEADLAGKDPKKLGIYYLNETKGQWEFIGGKADPVSKVVQAKTSHFSKYTLMVYEKTFADLNKHWAKADIEFAAAKHLIKGSTEKSFAPDRDITRAEFAALVVRTLGLETTAPGTVTFKDVRANDWFSGAVGAAVQAGIIKGYSAGTFAPNARVTREEMATMLARALKAAGSSQQLSNEEIAAALQGFRDTGKIAGWAKDSVAVAVKVGLLKGRTAGTFVPAQKATRAEAAVMIKRLFEQI